LPERVKEVTVSNGPEVVHRRAEVRDEDVPEFVRKWYGWASPIGLSLFLISLGLVAVLIRIAIVGLR
jgi:hypothetical protein